MNFTKLIFQLKIKKFRNVYVYILFFTRIAYIFSFYIAFVSLTTNQIEIVNVSIDYSVESFE